MASHKRLAKRKRFASRFFLNIFLKGIGNQRYLIVVLDVMSKK